MPDRSHSRRRPRKRGSRGGGGERRPKRAASNKTTHQTTELGLEAAYRRFDDIVANEYSLTGSIAAAETYIASPWVYGAVNAISTAIAQTPFKLEGYKGMESEEGALYSLVNRPNRYLHQNNSTKFRQAYFTELLTSGAVMRVFGEMDGMKPRTMFVDPRRHWYPQFTIDEFGRKVVHTWTRTASRSMRLIAEDEIVHDVLYNPFHDFEGLAPVTAAILSVEVALHDRQFASRFYKNDASTGLIFSTDSPGFGQRQADEAAQRWSEKGGIENSWQPKFVGWGLKPHKFRETLDGRAMQVLASLTKQDIVQGIFRVPLEIFGSTDRGNQGVVIGGGSLDPIKEMFLVNVVIPWARWYDDEFNSDVARRFSSRMRGYHDFTSNPVLENRRLERARVATELIDRGVPLNEVVRWLQLEIGEQPHGNEYWVENWRLPASVVLRAGDSILDQKHDDAVREHVEAIIRKAQTVEVKNSTMNRGDSRRNGDVVQEVMGDAALRL